MLPSCSDKLSEVPLSERADTANSHSNSSPRAPEHQSLATRAPEHPTEFGNPHDLSCFSVSEVLSASQAKLFLHVSKMLGIAHGFLDYHDDPGSILDRLYGVAPVQGGSSQTADLLHYALQCTAELSGSSSLLKLELAKRYGRCAARTRTELQPSELTHLHVALNLDAGDVAALIPVLKQLPRIPDARLDGLRDGLDLLDLLRTTGYFPFKRESPENPEPDLFLERLQEHLRLNATAADRNTRQLKHVLLVFTHADELAATSTKSLSFERPDFSPPELPEVSSPTPVEMESLVQAVAALVANPQSPQPPPVPVLGDTPSAPSAGERSFTKRMGVPQPGRSVILSLSTGIVTPSVNADQLDVENQPWRPREICTTAVNIANGGVGVGAACASGEAGACGDPMLCVDPVPASNTQEETVAAAAAAPPSIAFPLNALPATTPVHRTCAVSSTSLRTRERPIKAPNPDVLRLARTAAPLPPLPIARPIFQQYVERAQTRNRYPRRNEGPTDGQMVIFNCVETLGQKTRPGSLHDEKQVCELADSLGFQRRLYRDLKREHFRQTLASELMRPFPAVGGVFWLVMMGHGNQHGIMCADGGIISIAEIRHLLSTAPALFGVPKVVTIVSCRHSPTSKPVAQLSAVIHRTHPGYSSESPPTGQTPRPSHQLSDPPDGVRINMPEEGSDILMTMATIEGFVSLSTFVAGSPYIFHLCNVFRTWAAHEEAHVMLLRVNKIVSRAAYGERNELMQQPEFKSSMGELLYLARAAPAPDA